MAYSSPFARRALLGTAMFLAICPVLVALTREYATGDGPPIAHGDIALIAAASRNAAGFAQSLGPYSRFGFAHPGPAMFYLFAPFVGTSSNAWPLYWLTGLAWAAASVLFTREIAAARDAPGLALSNAALLVAFFCAFTRMHVLGVAAIQPWNPTIALIALVALVAASAAMVRRARWAPVVFATAFVVAVQSHLTAIPIALAVVIASRRELFALGHRAGPDERARGLAWAAPLAVVVMGFAPVVYDVVAHAGGNVAVLLRVLRDGAEGTKTYLDWPRITFAVASPSVGAVDVVGFRLDRFGSGATAISAIVAGLACVGALVDHRAGQVRWESLHRLTLAVALGAVATLPMLRGQSNAHPFYTLTLLALLLHVSALAPWVARVQSNRLALGVLAVVGAVLVVHVDRVRSESNVFLAERWPWPRVSRSLERVARCLASRGPFAIRVVGKSAWGPAATAAWVGLAHGQRPRLERSERSVFGEAFTYGSVAARPGRPTLIVGTYPTDMRIAYGSRPVVRLDVEMALGHPLVDDSYARRCLARALRRQRSGDDAPSLTHEVPRSP